MNLIKFIESFTNENMLNSTGSRRESFSQFGNLGKNLALASIPFGLAALSNKSYAGDITPTPATPIGALQFALILEYLEDEFYKTGLQTNGLITDSFNGGRDRKVFEQIAAHESDHVAFLKAALGEAAPEKPTFDFTVGGTFPTFTDYPTFLALAQAFEDTGVRAYKGQAGNLISRPELLTAALQIHSVEARHASEVRRLRGQKGWIVQKDRGGLPSAAQAVYDGEEITMQAGFNTAAKFGPDAGSAAFDEPLNTQQVVNIANIFIV